MERKVKGDVKPTRSVSSNRWMHEHVTDPFVQQAKKLGYRSRAAFKILEIDEKCRIFRRGLTVVDLGATPGGWSQIAAPKVGAGSTGGGRVIALDLLEMQGLPGVEFLKGDFTSDAGLAAVVRALGEKGRADLVLSDMAPNISGIGISDQAKSMYLCEIALDFAARFLEADGAFVVKTFQGVGFVEFMRQVRATFLEVKAVKPKSSRDRSTEQYLVGRGLRQTKAA
jgi:23S rRNA (uridine2552-2'-O)-methyltransferase